MIYSESESEPDFGFAINLVSDFDSASECDSELDSSVYESMNLVQRLWIYTSLFFLLCIYTLLNKPADNLFIHFHNRIKSYASNTSIMHIFFWHSITLNVCLNFVVKFSHLNFYVWFIKNRHAMKFNV